MPRREWKPNRRQRRVLLALLSGLPRLSGYPLCQMSQAGPGTVYPLLARLERLEWVSSEWETPNPLPPGRGRRRFYALTLEGRRNVARLLGMEETDAIRRT